MDDLTASAPATREFVHSFRRNFLSSERTYRLLPEGIEGSGAGATHVVPYRDIVEIREYRSKVWGALAAQMPRRLDYVLVCRDGQKIALDAVHCIGFRAFENRSSSCFDLIRSGVCWIWISTK